MIVYPFSKYLHDFLRTPENGVVMKILGRIEPKMKFHFPSDDFAISTPSDIHICLQSIWFPESGSEEFNVHFVMESRMNVAV